MSKNRMERGSAAGLKNARDADAALAAKDVVGKTVWRATICFLALVALPSAALLAQHHDHAAPTPTVEVVQEVSSIPDVVLTTQDGEEVHFYSDLVEGRTVVMNFIFTTCTTVCPPMGALFAQLQNKLAEQPELDVQLISVSVDPVTDTPQRLKAWRERLGGDPGWTLVTGAKADVDHLLKVLQVFTPDFDDHSPTLLVGNDRHGRWKRAYGLAAPQAVVDIVRELSAEAD